MRFNSECGGCGPVVLCRHNPFTDNLFPDRYRAKQLELEARLKVRWGYRVLRFEFS